MTGSLNIRRGGAFAEHLLNGIAGNQVDEKKDQRNDEPDDRQSVEHAEEEVAEHGISSYLTPPAFNQSLLAQSRPRLRYFQMYGQ